jgi:hypothetical protein
MTNKERARKKQLGPNVIQERTAGTTKVRIVENSELFSVEVEEPFRPLTIIAPFHTLKKALATSKMVISEVLARVEVN